MCRGLCQMQNDRNFIWRYQKSKTVMIRSLSTFAYEHLDIRFRFSFGRLDWFLWCMCICTFCWFRVDYTFRLLHVNISYLFIQVSIFCVLSLFFFLSSFRKFARRNKKKRQEWNWFGGFMSVEIITRMNMNTKNMH